jgi:hypothetical protein
VIFDGGDETPGLTVNFCYQNNRRKTRPSDLQEEAMFASDSSLEGEGFEPSVPLFARLRLSSGPKAAGECLTAA